MTWSKGAGIRQQLVVIDFHNKWNLVSVLFGNHPQYTKRRGDCVATAFDGKFDNVLGIKIGRIGSKRSTSRVFDSLVNRQDRNVSGIFKTTVTKNPLQVDQHARFAITDGINSIYNIRPGRDVMTVGEYPDTRN